MQQHRMNTTQKRRDGYIPSLDGWRAIAVFGVLFNHSLTWNIRGHSLRPLQDVGGLGVVLFFAISGFLITTRIVQEERSCGRFDLMGFYIRRFYRIQPAALLYLCTVAVLMIAGAIHCEWHFWVAALMMYQNFAFRGISVDPQSFFVGHFWTLAVEEHFYIFLSLILFVVRRYRLSALCFLYLLFSALQRHHASYIATHSWVIRRTWWQLQYLLFPSMLALALIRPRVRVFAQRWVRPYSVVLVWGLIILCHRLELHLRHRDKPFLKGSQMLDEVGFFPEVICTLIIIATALHERSWVTRLLESPLLKWVGKISYSLYLWHVLFFFRLAPELHITNPVLNAISGSGPKIIASFIAAALSYYLVEKPLMRKGHQLAPPASPGRPELIEVVR